MKRARVFGIEHLTLESDRLCRSQFLTSFKSGLGSTVIKEPVFGF